MEKNMFQTALIQDKLADHAAKEFWYVEETFSFNCSKKFRPYPGGNIYLIFIVS